MKYQDPQSEKWKMNQADWKRWGTNTLIFISPVVLIFLITVQTGGSFDLARGAALQQLLAIAIDFFRKLKADK